VHVSTVAATSRCRSKKKLSLVEVTWLHKQDSNVVEEETRRTGVERNKRMCRTSSRGSRSSGKVALALHASIMRVL
jgi:hypothetical protein